MKLDDLEEVREMVRLDDRRKIDEPCRLKELAVHVRHDGERNLFDLSIRGEGPYPVGDWASLQLFQKRLGIPLDFLATRCSENLAQQIVDQFLAAAPPRALLVRLKRGEDATRVRAVLPASFARFDNVDFLDVADRVAVEYGLKVERYRIDDLAFHCRFLFPESVNAGPAGRSDPHHFGVFIRNSEVGFGVPEAQFTIVRQVCTNGALGVTDEPLLRVHPSSLNSTPRERLVERFREGLENGLRDREKIIATIRSARRTKVKFKSVLEEIRAIHKFHGLSLRNLEIVNEAYAREADENGSQAATAFTLASALNRAAQHLPGDEAMRYETAAWEYMKGHLEN